MVDTCPQKDEQAAYIADYANIKPYENALTPKQVAFIWFEQAILLCLCS